MAGPNGTTFPTEMEINGQRWRVVGAEQDALEGRIDALLQQVVAVGKQTMPDLTPAFDRLTAKVALLEKQHREQPPTPAMPARLYTQLEHILQAVSDGKPSEERLAELLSAKLPTPSVDLAPLLQTLAKLDSRLAAIEEQVGLVVGVLDATTAPPAPKEKRTRFLVTPAWIQILQNYLTDRRITLRSIADQEGGTNEAWVQYRLKITAEQEGCMDEYLARAKEASARSRSTAA